MTETCAEFPARHVFIKCPECRRVIDEARLHDNLEVCPRCGKHFRVSGRARLGMTVDAGTFEEWDAELASEDFLSFPGYAEKLKSAAERSGERDAVVWNGHHAARAGRPARALGFGHVYRCRRATVLRLHARQAHRMRAHARRCHSQDALGPGRARD